MFKTKERKQLMKKTYMQPATRIVNIQTSQMIAVSIGIGESVNNASEAESRRRGNWDCDWDDEE